MMFLYPSPNISNLWIYFGSMEKIEKLFKALSDRNRLRIIAALREYNEMCACQIVELLQVTGATTSRHLSFLVREGLLDSRKDGRWVLYRLDYSKNNCGNVMFWLENQLIQSEIIMRDALALKEIMALDRENICRKQRGEKCCPC